MGEFHELLVRFKGTHGSWRKAHLQINASSSFMSWVARYLPTELVCAPTTERQCFSHPKFTSILVESGRTPHHQTERIEKQTYLVHLGRLKPGIKQLACLLVVMANHGLVQHLRCPAEVMLKQFASIGGRLRARVMDLQTSADKDWKEEILLVLPSALAFALSFAIDSAEKWKNLSLSLGASNRLINSSGWV
ncbi:LOW QUALITY PROTEIN: hypothetical protein PanWU01x14_119700 [Parasponia andersonii]|uniref:Uncharacterized protein n=1 Tax=Parasponia andersonii TaxID=3476 RepID=A0A2P5CVG2_PARAD|nr:LOW QUALITY PROTEIN: hypothetical protein PanWU01x14_119700 [Parasponia andersonii]